MLALAGGLGWAGLVTWLLSRTVRQFRAFQSERLVASPEAELRGRIAVIVPARDEARNIGPCLDSLRRQEAVGDGLSIIAVDDNSRDGTGARIRDVAGRDGRVRLVTAGALPPGWLGKPHACWVGARAAERAPEADWLCFIDADVRTEPALLRAAVAAAEAGDVALLSLQPLQELGSFWERIVIPAGMLLVACAKPVPLTEAAEVAVNGQFLLVRAADYRAVGGHRAVRRAICEDTALARLVQLAGGRVRVMAGEHLARTRMYRDLPSLWEGFAKNAVEILGSERATLGAAVGGVVVAWASVVLPVWLGWVAWREADAASIAGFAAGLLASLAVLGVWAGTLHHFRASWLLLPLLPVGASVAGALAFESVRRRRSGSVRWKGRQCPVPRGAESAG